MVTHQDQWNIDGKANFKELKDLLGNTAIYLQHNGSTGIASIDAKLTSDFAIGVYNLIDKIPHIDVLGKDGCIYSRSRCSESSFICKR